jgi:hypothetical protein
MQASPHRPRPYAIQAVPMQNNLTLTPQGDRKGPHPAPHRPRPYYDDESGITEQRLIVRAGAVWSGVGALAVALGG